ncbi:CorA family divalent cation transporter [Phenylobacterium sp.]|uniref:CorA family divalent cation transporter n=1 Tax=Phenylobacterium sp. TaxID=1871053 RepID=UPI00273367D8|nr:CorA family divalent cation transporter [Phenylobacterium sp.]MDP3852927.1 CorA family divalent cation transporter [Phenylobacterium sp.]
MAAGWALAMRRGELTMAQAGAFLWAYAFRQGLASALTDQALAGQDWVWTHFPLSDQRARLHVEQLTELPAAARDLILRAEQRVQIQLAGDWAFGVLPDFERDLDGAAVGVGRLMFAMSAKRLVTARRQALCVVDEVRREAERGAALASPAEAVIRLVERYVDLAEVRLHTVAAALDRIEDRMLADSGELDGVKLGPLRRGLSRDHREYLGLRSALHRAMTPREAHVVAILPPQLSRLAQEAEDLDREAASLQERARLLHEELDTRITSATNRSMRALTVMSSLLIPPTLIVGAFGMNLSGIPFAQDSAGFAAASALCLAVVGGAWLVLRRMRIMP